MILDDFKFGDKWLSDFEMVMCAPDDDQTFATRRVEAGEITPMRPNPNFYYTVYDSTLELHMAIIKSTAECGSQDSDIYLTGDEIHFLRTWLEGSQTRTELITPSQEDEMNTYYYGVFTEVQPMLNDGNCYGLELVFTCDAPYGYSDEITKRWSSLASSTPVTHKFYTISSETDGFLSPTIVVHSSSEFTGDEVVTISNSADSSNEMTLHMPSGLSQLNINCDKKTITDVDGNLIAMSAIGMTVPTSSYYNFISADTYLFYWLRLVSGDNDITITVRENTNIDYIDISTRCLLKTGGF